MDRFATPMFLFGVTAMVLLYDLGGQAMVVFPMLDGITRDPVLQGVITLLLLGCAAGLSLAFAGGSLALSEVRGSLARSPDSPTDR